MRSYITQMQSLTTHLYYTSVIFILLDYTTSIAKIQTAFTRVKCLLWSCPGVKFKLLFLVLLKMILPSGVVHTFENPETAMEFLNVNIKTEVTPTPSMLE